MRKKSDKLTKKVANKLGTRVTPGSGSQWYDKGDMGDSNWCIEHKFTHGKSFRITSALLNKVFAEAYRSNKEPALLIEFLESGKVVKSVVLIDTNTFSQLKDILESEK